MKGKIRKEYYRRVRLILKSELNAVNRIAAINSLAIPAITFSMNIINWQINDIKKLDTRLTTSVPASTSFIELDAATALHLGLIIKLTENPAKIATKMARPIRSQDLLLVI